MRKLDVVAACLTLLAGCATGGDETRRKLSGMERARLLVEVANGALMEGDPVGALQNLSAAEQLDGSLPELFHTKALALATRHDRAGALQAAEKAVSLRPDYAEANNTLGRLLIDDNQLARAEAPLMKAARDALYRESYKAETNLGILYYRNGKYKKSVARLDRAILLSPQVSCIAYYYRGHIKMRESRVLEAVDDYQRASQKICGKFADAHLALGIAHERNGEVFKARRKYLDLTEHFAASPAARQAMERLRRLP